MVQAASLFWPMLLVPKGYETIKVMRHKKVIFEGTVPGGFAMHLTIGDIVSVYQTKKRRGKRWLRKFVVMLYRDCPTIHFGKAYGQPDTYVAIKHLKKVSMMHWCQRRDHVYSVWGTMKQINELPSGDIIQW